MFLNPLNADYENFHHCSSIAKLQITNFYCNLWVKYNSIAYVN